MQHLVVDGVFSNAGKTTESNLMSLRRSLGKGIDPLFDYSVFEKDDKHVKKPQFENDETKYHAKSIWYELQRALRGGDDTQNLKNDPQTQADAIAEKDKKQSFNRGSSAFVSASRNYYTEKKNPQLLQGAPVGAYRPKYEIIEPRVKTPSLTKRQPSVSRLKLKL